jgi:hypothetical protein
LATAFSNLETALAGRSAADLGELGLQQVEQAERARAGADANAELFALASAARAFEAQSFALQDSDPIGFADARAQAGDAADRGRGVCARGGVDQALGFLCAYALGVTLNNDAVSYGRAFSDASAARDWGQAERIAAAFAAEATGAWPRFEAELETLVPEAGGADRARSQTLWGEMRRRSACAFVNRAPLSDLLAAREQEPQADAAARAYMRAAAGAARNLGLGPRDPGRCTAGEDQPACAAQYEASLRDRCAGAQ